MTRRCSIRDVLLLFYSSSVGYLHDGQALERSTIESCVANDVTRVKGGGHDVKKEEHLGSTPYGVLSDGFAIGSTARLFVIGDKCI